MKSSIWLLILLLSLSACGGSANNPSSVDTALTSTAHYQVSSSYNVPYGPLAGEELDLCVPKNPASPRPGVILIHGGGWVGGDKHFQDAFCTELAHLGFIAATINYRLAPAHTWPTQLVDAQLAVRWLRSQASRIHLDPKRICAYGTSAGAHLSIFLGVLASIHSGDEAGVLNNQSPAVSCVVDEFGPTDLTAPLNTAYQRSILHALFGGASLTSDPSGYRDASPLFDVTSQSASMLIVQGIHDTVVPPSQSQALEQKLHDAHVPVQYISYIGEHGFKGISGQEQNTIQEQTLQFLINSEHP